MTHPPTAHATKPLTVIIVTPALADANNGNWQTARRWAHLLRAKHNVVITPTWTAMQPAVRGSSPPGPVVMLALHATRSAPSIRAWHASFGPAGLAVVLTGTDLYRDLAFQGGKAGTNAGPVVPPSAGDIALSSLEAAGRIVVLQDQAPQAVPFHLRERVRVIFQSTTQRKALPKSSRVIRAVMVGHLRNEKDPLTLMRAAPLIESDGRLLIDHIGAALDEDLGRQAQSTAEACGHYRWLGALTHEQARRRIQRAHVLVHTSRLEGGAHVIMEAVRSGTPVLASRMAGNVGMLGREYEGYFEVGDAAGLAAALKAVRDDPRRLARLTQQCRQRAPLFDPVRESASLHALVEELAQRAPAAHP